MKKGSFTFETLGGILLVLVLLIILVIVAYLLREKLMDFAKKMIELVKL